MPNRPRRSLLYTPLSSDAMVRKAGTRGADVLIFDLEDGVLPEAKEAAREAARHHLADDAAGGAERLVRVNGFGTPWHVDDLAAIRYLAIEGVVLPKAETPNAVHEVDRTLSGRHTLFLMIETPAGVLRATELAQASPRVAGLIFGAADFRAAAQLLPLPDETEILFARSAIVLAARVAGIEAFDAPWFDIRDAAGLERSAALSRALGFDGRTAVHPAQVASIHKAFAPTKREVERARTVLAALADASAAGRGVAVVDGEMVEALHGRQAQRILDRAALQA
jgi:citrate lyase subunit beta/citryl-CoA lyase